MKKQCIILLVLIFCNHCDVWSQSQLKGDAFYTVAAPSGLTVRSKPSIDGEKLGKFPLGEHLELIEDTGKLLSIVDNGLAVHGNWFKVKRMNHSWDDKPTLTGYVFSGYLLKNKSRPYNPSDATSTENSTLKFRNFNLTFCFYETDTRYEDYNVVKNDTMYVYENVFNELNDKLIHIQPKVKTDKIELFYTFKEKVWEYGADALTSKKYYTWQGNSPFKKLPLTRNIALFPKIEYEKMETSRQVNLKLRDTLVHYPGEMGGTTATMSYRGKPCVHSIPDAILKIVLYYSNGTTEVKYVNINLSYGC
ncbi:SH3 domain-containing protein [Aquimarina sp. BL5]|uniref:SH3 domain-containing protein n=1 Tax=Aquimarina sp. BL5 TaxID=1714860 RepID=UPI000E53ADD1|nr:SH3 domain-containing protein [Aquimarina sp. BL5]AXT50602.1 SH3 domain-containing protein [Aquimarina sp. BL5]RKM97715.1 SH3 domain-containing protein [Aquimarina sp. BL5]